MPGVRRPYASQQESDERGLTLSVTPHCLLLCEDVAPPLKSNVFFAAEFGVKGGEGEAAGAVETADSGEIGLLSAVEQRDLPDVSSAESPGGSKGRSDTGGVYDWFSKKGANGISLLRKLIPLVLVVSSFISVGSSRDGDIGAVFFVTTPLHSRTFSPLAASPTHACMDVSSGDETELSSLPSSD